MSRPPMKKPSPSQLRRVIRQLFRFYPRLMPAMIVCILFSAIVATIPSLLTQKVIAAIESGDQNTAKEKLVAAETALSKAASKGVLHKNNASRKVSRLAKAVSGMK